MTRPIAHRPLYEDVAERVRRLIYRGELPPGAWIDERALVLRFGISRTPLLEGLCALEAVRKATRADVRRLEGLHARLERHGAAGEVDRYYEQNYAFHEAVQEVAANPWLSRALSELRRFLRLLRGRQLRVPGRLEASLEEHRRFMGALRRRDGEEAERAMRAHLMSQRAALAVQDAGALARPGKTSERGRAPRARRGRSA